MKLKEKQYEGISGLIVAVFVPVFLGLAALILLTGRGPIPSLLIGIPTLFAIKGFTVVGPNESRVLTFFGKYVGTLKDAGFWWLNPFLGTEQVSLKTANYETQKLKVNDNHGNPIEIAAIVVWRIKDSAEAFFNVEDYEAFMNMQSESALRELASNHPYDKHEKGVLALRSDSDKIAGVLRDEIQKRLEQAGIEIIEARLSHLAYSPEVAGSMLKLQQATAIIAARQKIVEGAVGMVDLALKQIAAKRMAKLSPREKARLVSDLLVVLCADREVTPMISVGGGAGVNS
jgi:regulator of protease activity HflC (stomatin/prohibitin superfamily)